METRASRNLVLVKRNCDVTGNSQGELVTMLKEFSDFATRNAITRAHATEMTKANKHEALFGVRYHVDHWHDLAHVERQWMFIKQQVRPLLTGAISLCSMFNMNFLFWQVPIAHVSTSCRRLIATTPCTKRDGMPATVESLCEHTLRWHWLEVSPRMWTFFLWQRSPIARSTPATGGPSCSLDCVVMMS